MSVELQVNDFPKLDDPPAAVQPPETGAAGEGANDLEAILGEPFARTQEFWICLGLAAALGAALAFPCLGFVEAVEHVPDAWLGSDPDARFGQGKWWWLAITTGTGAAVGAARYLLRAPAKEAGMLKMTQAMWVEPLSALQAVPVSLISLMGGASLGPEAALGTLGGAAGTFVAEWLKLERPIQAASTMAGMGGAFGGLLSSPVLASLLLLELMRPGKKDFPKMLICIIVATSISFAIFYPITGASFLKVYELPPYTYSDWHLFAGIVMGAIAALVGVAMIVIVALVKKVAARLGLQPEGYKPGWRAALKAVLVPTGGGLVYGLIGIAMPLTFGSGSAQLGQMIAQTQAGRLSAGLLAASMFAKMVTFAVCFSTGFVGGFVFPVLFIGGAAGTLVYKLCPWLPWGLCFSCMFAAVPGSILPLPLFLIFMSGYSISINAVELSPVVLALVTAFVVQAGLGMVLTLATRARARAAQTQRAA
ncbi:hypothetical protein WJX72_000470 [[Myrmecia] bisecta]|uniref:Chloride channel protein n=1 Tax=[Myrmecia] bisecta TaxID=41462 RepID=A0AAW1Q803_9CHLO